MGGDCWEKKWVIAMEYSKKEVEKETPMVLMKELPMALMREADWERRWVVKKGYWLG